MPNRAGVSIVCFTRHKCLLCASWDTGCEICRTWHWVSILCPTWQGCLLCASWGTGGSKTFRAGQEVSVGCVRGSKVSSLCARKQGHHWVSHRAGVSIVCLTGQRCVLCVSQDKGYLIWASHGSGCLFCASWNPWYLICAPHGIGCLFCAQQGRVSIVCLTGQWCLFLASWDTGYLIYGQERPSGQNKNARYNSINFYLSLYIPIDHNKTCNIILIYQSGNHQVKFQ